MTIQNLNLTTVRQGNIFQCVNCQNAMGAGLARAIFEKWPKVKTEYHAFCRGESPLQLLGEIQIVELSDHLHVINCFGQLSYGGPGRHADYGAIKSCFETFSGIYAVGGRPKEIYFPEYFACGLAGGDIKIVHELIGTYFPDAILAKF